MFGKTHNQILKDKTSEFFENSEVCVSLHQHPDRVFQETSQRLHELRRFGSVADAVVNGDGGFHAVAANLH